MYDNAETLHHFKLCQRCTLSYLSKVSTPIEPEIGMLFSYLMEMFVKKVCPEYDIKNITPQTIFDLKVVFENTEQKQSMIQLRELVQEVYMSLAPKIDLENRLTLYKTALPVIVS
jgi:DNA-directed RNA polymerase subunit F